MLIPMHVWKRIQQRYQHLQSGMECQLICLCYKETKDVSLRSNEVYCFQNQAFIMTR